MMTHTSLWVGAENVFHDPNGWEFTSDCFRHYAGGLLRHGGALSALVAATEDAYPIRAGGRETVLRAYLSRDNSDAVCRVPARTLNGSARRLKWRAGNAAGNPYLALAATLAAGADGLRRRIEPAMTPAGGALPVSLKAALTALDRDREFLRDAGFDDKLIDSWIALSRSRPARSAA